MTGTSSLARTRHTSHDDSSPAYRRTQSQSRRNEPPTLSFLGNRRWYSAKFIGPIRKRKWSWQVQTREPRMMVDPIIPVSREFPSLQIEAEGSFSQRPIKVHTWVGMP